MGNSVIKHGDSAVRPKPAEAVPRARLLEIAGVAIPNHDAWDGLIAGLSIIGLILMGVL